MGKQSGENSLIRRAKDFMRKAQLKSLLLCVLCVLAPAPLADAQPPTKTVKSRDFIKDSAVYYGSIWAFRFFYVRNKNARIYDTSPSDWWKNITQAPVTNDGDRFFTNYIVHPFAGYVSYLYYREMGYGFWGSALGSALQSTLFEYTVEGLVETPSLPDLLSTPGIGVLAGAAAEALSDRLYGTGNTAAKVLAHVVNPMRNFVNNEKVVLINPLRGTFEYSQSFDTSNMPHKLDSLSTPEPHSFRSALPRGYAGGRFEVAALKNARGQIVLYNVGAELPSEDYGKSVYIFFNQSGVNNLGPGQARDGYELSNFTVGAKAVITKTPSYWAAAGIEAHLPTVYKDNVGRLEEITSLYERDLPVYLEDAYSVAPFVGGAVKAGALSFEAAAGAAFIGKAENLEGDSWETVAHCGASLGISVPGIVQSSMEIKGVRMQSRANGSKNSAYFTAGLRFGSLISPSVALQIPVGGKDSEAVSRSFITQIQVRF